MNQRKPSFYTVGSCDQIVLEVSYKLIYYRSSQEFKLRLIHLILQIEKCLNKYIFLYLIKYSSYSRQ